MFLKNKLLLSNDKLVITFNFKNEPVTVPTSEKFDAIEKSSDIKAFASPTTRKHHNRGAFLFLVVGDPSRTEPHRRKIAKI